jgi:hypothetical protein
VKTLSPASGMCDSQSSAVRSTGVHPGSSRTAITCPSNHPWQNAAPVSASFGIIQRAISPSIVRSGIVLPSPPARTRDYHACSGGPSCDVFHTLHQLKARQFLNPLPPPILSAGRQKHFPWTGIRVGLRLSPLLFQHCEEQQHRRHRHAAAPHCCLRLCMSRSDRDQPMPLP